MKNILIAIVTMSASLTLNAQHISKYVLDNYLITLNSAGVHIGKVYPQPSNIVLLSDTSSLFRIDSKENVLSLKKNKEVVATQPVFRYGITLLIDGDTCKFELLKDGYSKNRVVAHRGAWKKTEVLQNSIRSFQNAVALECQGSELDVWLTADNKVILSHDPHIYGVEIENTNLMELFQKTNYEKDPVVSLQELLLTAKFQNTTHPIIEIKDSQKGLNRTLQLTDSVVNIVHRMNMQGDVQYISFNYEVLKRIRLLDPTARVLYLQENKKELDQLLADKISGIDYSYYAYRKDSELIEKAKKKNLLTNVWTVNNAEDLKNYYLLGVDYITTDEPELMLKIINSLK